MRELFKPGEFYSPPDEVRPSLGYLTGLESDLMDELRARSRASIYQSDPEAWLHDILGKRWWSKQREIGQSVVDNEFTIVKSCNGVGKTDIGADIVTWFVSVFPPETTQILLTAPVREQINSIMFKYLRDRYNMAAARGHKLVGEITRFPKWVTREPYDIDLVLPKRPADQNLISSFQGVHAEHVLVVMDEAGGLPRDMFVAANAVTTNDHARILAIGNPDRVATGFQDRFIDDIRFGDWNRISISAYDSPSMTGEIIYPDDPQEDARVRGLLVKPSWVEMMERSAPPGVVKAKVYGEFPDQDDKTFFTQDVINKAIETERPKTGKKRMGVDLAFEGEDKSVVYLNWNGRLRKIDSWNKESALNHVLSARRIHKLAQDNDVDEVRVDKSGTGAGVYSNLTTLEEFSKRRYTIVGINGANKSPNSEEWLNARAYHYDSFRKGMADGEIDLDFEEKTLQEEMIRQPYIFTEKSQLKMMTKKEMKREGIDSPDDLDAAIYSWVDVSDLVEGELAGAKKGDIYAIDPMDMFFAEMQYGMPV